MSAEKFDAAAIAKYQAAKNQTAPKEIIIYDSLDSTMNAAKKLVNERGAENADRVLILAETQTAGRGRRGRDFFSPPATGIYATLILTPPPISSASQISHNSHSAQIPHLLTPLVAVAICAALEKFCAPKIPQIKWVNDILIDRKKVAGILVEAEFSGGRVVGALVGIGINVSTQEFPLELREIAGACGQFGSAIAERRNELIADLVAEFFARYDDYNPEEILSAYRKRSAIIGEEISYERAGENFVAVAESINDDGNLVVRNRDGRTFTLNAGEISVKWKVDKN